MKYDLQYCSAGDKDKGRLASLLSFGRRRGCKEGESEGSSLDSMTAGELPISMAMRIQRITKTRLLTQPIHPSVTKVKECNCDTLRLQSDQMYVMQDMKDDAISS